VSGVPCTDPGAGRLRGAADELEQARSWGRRPHDRSRSGVAGRLVL